MGSSILISGSLILCISPEWKLDLLVVPLLVIAEKKTAPTSFVLAPELHFETNMNRKQDLEE